MRVLSKARRVDSGSIPMATAMGVLLMMLIPGL